jgi:hypothetical protein
MDSPLVIPSWYRYRAVVLVLNDIDDEIKKKGWHSHAEIQY